MAKRFASLDAGKIQKQKQLIKSKETIKQHEGCTIIESLPEKKNNRMTILNCLIKFG